MSTRQRKQSRLRPLLLPGACLLLLAYFAYHAVEGEYGLYALDRLKAREAALQQELAELKERRDPLERRVALMRPESLDPDMVDERARHALNMVHRNDVVILRPVRR
jgi:cell division protein FtsB